MRARFASTESIPPGIEIELVHPDPTRQRRPVEPIAMGEGVFQQRGGDSQRFDPTGDVAELEIDQANALVVDAFARRLFRCGISRGLGLYRHHCHACVPTIPKV